MAENFQAIAGINTTGRVGRHDGTPVRAGYAQARLWLGMSAVGTFVVLAVLALAAGLPTRINAAVDPAAGSHVLTIAGFVLVYAAVQFPFDLLGGYLLPKYFRRAHLPILRYTAALARGVGVHSTALFVAAIAILLAGRWGGIGATLAAGAAVVGLLLVGRVTLATLTARLRSTTERASTPPDADDPAVVLIDSDDEGFTGGIVGLTRPHAQLLPQRWRQVLGPDGFRTAVARRSIAVASGGWHRGRLLALAFTFAGLGVSAWLVPSTRLGTAGGTIELSLWFTLWSFVGLLVLPTLSRQGVMDIDRRLLADGHADAMRANTRILDGLQDDEPTRPRLVEAIFHTIPSVDTRLAHGSPGGRGFWDVARTAVYLSTAGIGLLGRAVHCNCGRPALWVFLPTD